MSMRQEYEGFIIPRIMGRGLGLSRRDMAEDGETATGEDAVVGR